MSKRTKQQIEEARAKLREWLPIGSTVYGVVTHVARSGMSRRIRFFIVATEHAGRPHRTEVMNVSGYIAAALDWRRDLHTGDIHVDGCGMDMIFHTINSLSYTLHGMDFDKAPRCAEHSPEAPSGRRCAEDRDASPDAAARCYRPGYTLFSESI